MKKDASLHYNASVVELLETKIAPAGVVNLTLANGVLTISGNAEANELKFSLSGDSSWAITDTVGAADTEIFLNGVSQGFSATILAPSSVKGTLGAGDDHFTFDTFGLAGGISLSGGDGNDTILMDHAFIGGGLTVDGGAGNDTFVANDFTVIGDVMVKGGAGGESIGLTQMTAGKNVTLDLGAGGYEAGIGNESKIAGNVKVISSSADPNFSGFGLYGTGVLIQGSLTVGLGGGIAQLGLGSGAGDSITVAGATKVVAGNGSLTFNMRGDLQFLAGLNVAAGGGANTLDTTDLNSLKTGAFTYTGGSGDDQITLAGSQINLGATNVSLGDGANSFEVTTLGVFIINGNATFTAGKGNDDIEFTSAIARVNGLLKVTAGAGNNHLYYQPSFSGHLGALNYTGGAGDDILRLHSAAAGDELFIIGAVNAVMAAGNVSEVTLDHARVFGALNVTSTALSNETFRMEDALLSGAVSLKINGAAGASVRLDDVSLASSIFLDTGAGNDGVTFDNTVAGSSRTSVFGGAVKVLLGTGDTDYFVGGRSGGGGTLGCVFGGAILIDGGAGVTDSADFMVGYGNTFAIAPTAASHPGVEFFS